MTANEDLLLGVVQRLRPVLSDLVFVGGATVELYITDPASARPRPTTDVDAVCEVESRSDYHELGERIRELGFAEDKRSGAPIGRWVSTDGVLDLMPRHPDILGFTNIWYDLGIHGRGKETAKRAHHSNSRPSSVPGHQARSLQGQGRG